MSIEVINSAVDWRSCTLTSRPWIGTIAQPCPTTGAEPPRQSSSTQYGVRYGFSASSMMYGVWTENISACILPICVVFACSATDIHQHQTDDWRQDLPFSCAPWYSCRHDHRSSGPAAILTVVQWGWPAKPAWSVLVMRPVMDSGHLTKNKYSRNINI